MPPGGGEPKPAAQLDAARDQTAHQYPQFLPDGVRFLFTVVGGSSAGIYVGSLESPDVKLILAGARRTVFAGGYLIYPSGQALMAQRFDPASLTLSGEPVRVAESVQRLSPEPAYAGFSASPDVLVHREHEPEPPNELVWYDRSGKRLGVVGAPAGYTNPALSPDGRRLAIGMEDPASGKRDVWVMDLARGTNTRLTFDPDEDFNPLWSPDGNEIYFTSERSGTRQLYRKPASGVAAEQPLNEGTGRHSAENVSPDGKMVLYNNTGDLWMAPSVGGKGQIAVGGPGSQDQAAISPDGKWIAYRSTESGRGEIYVQNFPPAGGKWQISTDGGYEPAWRGDGRELYYLQRDGKLMAVSFAASGASLEAGKPVALFAPPLTLVSRRNRYVVTRDGSKFLVVTEQQVQRPVKFNVVVNWAPGLGK
jgi:Tol biopolymer transport system component